MQLEFEIVKQIEGGAYPDLLNFANTQGQAYYIKNGQLYGATTNAIDNGEWEDAIFENGVNISPDVSMTNFEVKVMPGWGAVGIYKSENAHKLLIYEFNQNDFRNHVAYRNLIEVRNKDEVPVTFLSPNPDNVKDCYVDVRLNGESTLEFSLPANSDKIKEITPESVFYVGWRAYMLRKDEAIEVVRDNNNKLWTKFMAVERWRELEDDYIEPYLSNDPTNPTPSDLTVIIVGGGSNLSGNRYVVGTAAHALYAVLNGSGWNLGVCDIDGIYDLEVEKVSRLALIKSIQEIWGGYLVFDSVNKIVHLRDANKWQPYTGFQVRYRKNLKHISRTQSNKIITKLYAFGHDDLDIATINDGKKYITNHSYTTRNYVGIYKNQDIYNQEELLAKAMSELELMCRPRYLYSVKILDLNTLPEFSHEFFFLGEMVDVIDPDVVPSGVRPRIIRHRYNLFQPWICEIDIGDPEERLIEKLKASFDIANFIEGKFNGIGDFSGHSLENLTVVTDKINNLAITTAKINDAAITTAKIQDLAVTNAKIESLIADKITAGTIEATIELKAAKITSNSTITGVVIRTAESPYRRIELTSDGLTSYSSGTTKHGFSLDSYGALNLFNGGSIVGSMQYDNNGAGTASEAENRMFITTYSGYAMKLLSSGDMSLEAPEIWFKGDVELPDGDGMGHTYIGGTRLDTYIENIAYDVAQSLIPDS